MTFNSETVSIERSGPIATVWLDRPEHRNAISSEMFDDIGRAMAEVGDDADARVVVVAARGPAFTVGIDLAFLARFRSAPGGSDAARKRRLYDEIRRLQRSISALE
ncbi:MAG TPA: enoyl-CoA hydratase-related protein, partial [Acidimicrobiia bacterium]|nr:enoyl-CoA hydratase-related protein [Acidimicrobiia bacterium]